MGHKQRCIMHCNEYLQSFDLSKYFTQADFNSYYKKHKGSNANPYTFGMEVGDYIIKNSKP